MSTLRAAGSYFAIVFVAGFVLGTVRVALLVPRFGARTAELVELPLMVLVVVLASRWRHRTTPHLRPQHQLAIGGLALLLVLGAEFGLGAALTGRSPVEVVTDRDPVSGAFYCAALVVFALAPWWWARRAVSRRAARPRPRR